MDIAPLFRDAAATTILLAHDPRRLTEAAALRDGFLGAMRQFGQTVRTGKSDIDLAYGKIEHGDLDKSVIDFFGHLHAALKLPAKLNEF